MYTVKRSGYKKRCSTFDLLDDANKNAIKKSIDKNYTYSVYDENGTCINSYIKGKLLPKWTTLYKKQYKTGDNDWNEIKKSRGASEYPYNVEIATTGNKTRILFQTQTLHITKKGIHCSRIEKAESITITDDFKFYISTPNSIRRKTGILYLHSWGYVFDNDIITFMRKYLSEKRPDISFLLSMVDTLSELLTIYITPNAYFIYDKRTKKIRAREHDIPMSCIIKYFPHYLLDEVDLVKYLINKYKLPDTKSMKRLYYNNITACIIVKNIIECGIKDINNIRKIPCLGLHILTSEINSSIIKKIVKYKGENLATKMIVNEDFNDLIDADRMIRIYEIEKDYVNYIIKNARNFAEIHDSVIALTRKDMGYRKNLVISYSDEIKTKYNRKYGDIRFELAKDSKDLAIVGSEMGICVGGYARDAYAHKTTIIKMMKQNSYIACIEIINNGLKQIKAAYNNPVSIEYKNIIDEWVKDSGIKNKNCEDYKKIGEVPNYTFNHAVIQPEEYNNREDRAVLRIVRRTPRPKEDYEKNNWDMGKICDHYEIKDNKLTIIHTNIRPEAQHLQPDPDYVDPF